MGVDLTSVLLGLGAFSIAISFATSNIIQNLVSGLIVLGEKAFEVGMLLRFVLVVKSIVVGWLRLGLGVR